jgi:hypothetical protein
VAKELADQIVEELDRIHDFSETALGRLAGCVGACAATWRGVSMTDGSGDAQEQARVLKVLSGPEEELKAKLLANLAADGLSEKDLHAAGIDLSQPWPRVVEAALRFFGMTGAWDADGNYRLDDDALRVRHFSQELMGHITTVARQAAGTWVAREAGRSRRPKRRGH